MKIPNLQSNRSLVFIGVSVLATLAFLSLPKSTTQISAKKEAPASAVEIKNYFEEINLEARAVYVYDISNKKALFARNETHILPLASLTKIMTAVTATDLAPKSTLVTIDTESLKQEGDSGLHGDERWTLSKLLQYTLVVSSNDGAAAIASSLGMLARDNASGNASETEMFVDKMNKQASSLGLVDMRFYNSSGLDVSKTQAGGYGSAESVAFLMEHAMSRFGGIIEPTRYSSFTVSSEDEIVHDAQNTNISINKIPGLIAGKTGYSNLAGGNMAVIFDAGIQRPIVVVVLGSTFNDRFTDVEKLVDATIMTITQPE